MGSIGFHVDRDTATKQAVADYLDEAPNPSYEVLYRSWQPTGDGRFGEWSYVMYEAIRDVRSGDVFARIALAARNDGMVYVKELDETVGPCQTANVPQRLLRMLTPTDSEWANEWRRQAWRFHEARAEARAAVGKTVTFAQPINYGGDRLCRFVVRSLTRFASPDPCDARRFRAPRNWWLYPHTVTRAA